MNIFALDNNPILAAESHCDQHLNKMILESCQMLMTPYWIDLGITSRKEINLNRHLWINEFFDFPRKEISFNTINPHPYGIGYKNHPCTRWVLQSVKNWEWLKKLAYALIEEKKYRSGSGHICENILDWYSNKTPKCLPNVDQTIFVQAIPEWIKNMDPVQGYRSAYIYNIYYKGWLPTWTKREIPDWYQEIHPNEMKLLAELKRESRLSEIKLRYLTLLLKANQDMNRRKMNSLIKSRFRKNKNKRKVTI